MQGGHQQQQQPQYASHMGNAELWDALQRQQAQAQQSAAAGMGQMNGMPSMLHGGGTMQPLHSYALPTDLQQLQQQHGGGGMAQAPQQAQQARMQQQAQQAPMVLSGKPLAFGNVSQYGAAAFQQQPQLVGAGGPPSAAGHPGITGVPSSLTSLPGLHYGSTHLPQHQHHHQQPQLYGSSGPVGVPMGGQAQHQPSAGYSQLSGLSSQLSSGMMMSGVTGGSQLIPTMQPLQLSGAGLASAAHLAPPTMMYQQQQHHHQQHQHFHNGMAGMPIPMPISTQPAIKMDPDDPNRPSSSHSVAMSLPIPGSPESEEEEGGDGGDGDGSPTDCMGSGGLNKSRYRGVSYDRKKAKWRVQIKVAALGKSGVSVGYFDTEEAAARAYDRAAIGLLGRDNPNLQTNFDARDYTGETIPPLTGKTREEVKTTLKSERIKQAPRRRFTSRQRTSRFMGVGSSNRKNQWQARILVHGKVTHLGYYETEEEAAKVYDKVSLALHGDNAQTNFPASNYGPEDVAVYSGLDREDLQRALGVKPMDKSSKFRGVSKKKGKWEAKVMVNRRWAYRELFDSEEEAARAYDRALWRLKPKEAHSYVNFKDDVPPEVAHMMADDGVGIGGGTGGAGPLRHRGGALGSSEEEEAEAAASDGSDGMSDDDGSGRAPLAPSWTQRTSRSGRRAGLRGAPPSAAGHSGVPSGLRVASAPNLHSHAAATAAAAAAEQQRMQAAGVAPLPAAPANNSGFVALPGGGLQLQFGAPSGAPGGGMFAPAGPPAGAMQASPPRMPAVSGGGGLPPSGRGSMGSQPLLVRVGSETHLIPQQQQHVRQHVQPAAPDQRMVAGLGGSMLGKRMNRIQSEPAFNNFKDEMNASGDLSDLMNDRDLFKAFDLTGMQEAQEAGHSSHSHGGVVSSDGGHDGDGQGGASGHGGGGGSSTGGGSQLDLDLDTSELLDFIKDMPDHVMAPGGGGGGNGGRGQAGMFKSRSMGNLMDLSAPFFDEEDEALANMEFARPRKMSKSMSMNQLAGLEAGGGTSGGGGSGGRPPLPPSVGGDPSKLGPLGKPIRRTNTFSSSLAVLQEADREGRAADELASHGITSHHSSGDDLVQRLLAPATLHDDDPMRMLTDFQSS